MSELVRISLSIERPLLKRLEEMLVAGGYTNRSEFVRDMIRQGLVEHQWRDNREAVGTITLVYDHHARLLTEKLTDLQHEHHGTILAATHVHLDEDTCVEMILARGRADRICRITDMLRRQKGVLHAALSMSSTGEELA